MKSELLIKKKAIAGTIWKFLERISAQLVSMIVTIVLARLLSPDDYSVVGIVNIFFTFANVFISGGFNAALIQKQDADKEDYSSVFVISLSISIIIYIILFLCAPYIANIYKKPILTNVIRVMGISLPVYAIKSVVCAYISSNLQFKKFFFATFGGTIISAIVGIGMAYYGFGAWALVFQQTLNTIIDTIILYFTTDINLDFKFSLTRIRVLFSYGWNIFLSSTISAIYSEVNPLFIGLKYSGSSMSFYSKGKSFPGLLSSICNSTLSSVLFPVLSKFQDDKAELLRCTRRFIKLSSFLIFPVLLGFYSIADNFVVLLLTEKWLPATQYIKIFCISELFVSVHSGNCEAIKALGKSRLFLKMEFIKKSLYFVIIGLFMAFTNSPVELAYSTILCTIVALIVNSSPNIYLLNYKIKDQVKDVTLNLFSAIIMALIVSKIKIGGIPIFVELIIQIFIGMITYIIICIITHNENFIYIYNTIKGYLRKSNHQ